MPLSSGLKSEIARMCLFVLRSSHHGNQPDDGGNKRLRNVGQYPTDYIAGNSQLDTRYRENFTYYLKLISLRCTSISSKKTFFMP
jgi:hypothetical protein